jgi:outer membrane protein TolC
MLQMCRRLIAAAAVCCVEMLAPITALGAEPLTLADAVNRALKLAPGVESAAAQSDLNTAKLLEARAPLYPSIFANAEYNQAPGYDQIITNRGLTLGQLVLDYTAYDGGRRTAQVRSARYAAEAAVLGVDAVRSQIIFDSTIAYFDLLRAREIQTELKANLERLTKYAAIVESLERSGRAIANDVLKIRAARDSAELVLASTDEAVAHASLALGSMIGEFDNSALRVAEISGLPAPPAGDIQQNPAFRAAERQVQSAKLSVQAARAERSPIFKLALTSGWEGIDPPKTFGHHLGASYDGAVSVPIFQGGLVRSHIDEALAAQHAAIAQQRQVELELKRNLADAESRYRGARRQLEILARSQSTANDAFALDWTRFLGGGNVTLLEVTDAYQLAENLRLARFDREFAARQAKAQAQLVLGVTQ